MYKHDHISCVCVCLVVCEFVCIWGRWEVAEYASLHHLYHLSCKPQTWLHGIATIIFSLRLDRSTATLGKLWNQSMWFIIVPEWVFKSPPKIKSSTLSLYEQPEQVFTLFVYIAVGYSQLAPLWWKVATARFVVLNGGILTDIMPKNAIHVP